MSTGLLDVIRRSKNAMRSFETALRIHSNNSANLGTYGYKTLDYSFKTIFNDVTRSSQAPNGEFGSVNPTQYGSGVTLAGINLDFSQGDLGEGSDMDLAVSGRGLFMVSRDGGDSMLYTRNGEFSIDTTGNYIVDSSGRQLFGYEIGGTELVPIETQGYSTLGWRADGVLVGNYDSDGTSTTPEVPLYQVALSDFRNLSGLLQYDGTAFEETLSSGSPTYVGKAGEETLGNIEPHKLEKSNVFFIGETIDSIEVQRALSASLTAIKMANDIIAQVMNRLSG